MGWFFNDPGYDENDYPVVPFGDQAIVVGAWLCLSPSSEAGKALRACEAQVETGFIRYLSFEEKYPEWIRKYDDFGSTDGLLGSP